MMHPVQAKVERAEWWRDHLRKRCRAELTPRSGHIVLIPQIQKAVCDYYGITPVRMIGRERGAETVLARQVAMYLARSLSGQSFPRIGRHFGGRDHTTVLHSYNKIGDQMTRDPELEKDVNEISAAVFDGW